MTKFTKAINRQVSVITGCIWTKTISGSSVPLISNKITEENTCIPYPFQKLQPNPPPQSFFTPDRWNCERKQQVTKNDDEYLLSSYEL